MRGRRALEDEDTESATASGVAARNDSRDICARLLLTACERERSRERCGTRGDSHSKLETEMTSEAKRTQGKQGGKQQQSEEREGNVCASARASEQRRTGARESRRAQRGSWCGAYVCCLLYLRSSARAPDHSFARRRCARFSSLRSVWFWVLGRVTRSALLRSGIRVELS